MAVVVKCLVTVDTGALRVSHLTVILGAHRDRLYTTSRRGRVSLFERRKAAQALLSGGGGTQGLLWLRLGAGGLVSWAG